MDRGRFRSFAFGAVRRRIPSAGAACIKTGDAHRPGRCRRRYSRGCSNSRRSFAIVSGLTIHGLQTYVFASLIIWLTTAAGDVVARRANRERRRR